MTKHSSQDQKALSVLQAVYSHRLDKNDFGTLLQDLDEAILGLASAEFETDGIPARLVSLEGLDEHFDLATRLDFKLSEEDEEQEINDLCQSNAACFAVNQNGTIIAISETCRERLGNIAQQPIERLPLRGSDIRVLRKAVQEITASEAVRKKDRALFARHAETENVAIFHTKHFRRSRVVVFLFDHLGWTEFVEDAIKRNFGLTKAECAIVQRLVAGRRPAEIASDLGRSVETIRSHIKSVQSKTYSRDTSALIRLMCEIMTLSIDFEVHEAGLDNADLQFPAPYQMNRARSPYDVTQMVGVKDPHPNQTALFVHGMLQGPFLSKKLRSNLRNKGIEMICPSRPGYGQTPAVTNDAEFIQTSLNQMLHLLDFYKIEQAVLVSHMVGTQFAARFAAFAPDRVHSLVSVSGVLPMMSRSQLKQQNAMHRMVMLAAKYSPATLGYIAQIGERYLREGNEIKCLKQLFSRSNPDKQALSNSEVSAILKRGFSHLAENGKSAFKFEAQSGIADWEDAFRNLNCPCSFLHGDADAGVPAGTIREIMPDFPNWRFTFIEDAGQTLLHTHPHEVTDHIAFAFANSLEQVNKT